LVLAYFFPIQTTELATTATAEQTSCAEAHLKILSDNYIEIRAALQVTKERLQVEIDMVSF
jgi:hypothetical protein